MKSFPLLIPVAIAILFVMCVVLIAKFSSRNLVAESEPLVGPETQMFLKDFSAANSLGAFNSLRSGQSALQFHDAFEGVRVIEESEAAAVDPSVSWWLNSGGRITVTEGRAASMRGVAIPEDIWRKRYLTNNPRDTDYGTHPQNLLRLVHRHQWRDFSQQAYFKVTAVNLSDSPNRNATNGLFLFNRYQTGDDLYYTGIRVDGAVVIKKKQNGIYYTMAHNPVLDGTYEKNTAPSLLPLNTWIGLKSEVETLARGSVSIKLYTDIGHTGTWTLAAQAIDDGEKYGGAAISRAGFPGIRTDFMDVEIDEYAVGALR